MAPIISSFASAAARNYGFGLLTPLTTTITSFTSSGTWEAPWQNY